MHEGDGDGNEWCGYGVDWPVSWTEGWIGIGLISQPGLALGVALGHQKWPDFSFFAFVGK